LLPLACALIAVVAFVLLATWAALQIQTALAGFLNGESVWSKAQKQASIDLLEYAGTGNPADYADFQRNYSVLVAYRSARSQIRSGHYNRTAVAGQFRRSHAMPSAIPGVIFMLDHFANAPYMRRALDDWRSTDGAITELGGIAIELHHAWSTGSVTPAYTSQQRSRIAAINKFIEPRSMEFSATLADGAVVLGKAVYAVVLLAIVLTVVLWVLMARRTFARIRGSEARYRMLFDSAVDAMVMVDEDSGRILDANRAAAEWTGRGRETLFGFRYVELFESYAAREGAPGSGELRSAGGRIRTVETQSSMVAWGDRVVRQVILRDVSDRVESERARRTAAEALASIAEGVIIADAERRVLSVNAAATNITGFDGQHLLGTRFDDWRSMADGGPMPETIWDQLVAANHWSGEVQTRHLNGSAYPEKLSISTIRDADNMVQHYVAVFSDISVAKADRRRLEYLATHDALTGLVNRVEFQRRCEAEIERARFDHRAVTVLFIDLDAFKFINDSYSHAVGDRLLKQVARRIRHELLETDVVGRIGGDEFTVLLVGGMAREDVAVHATRMLGVLAEPFHVDEYEIAVSASIGIAGFPLDGDDAQALMANADAAMYVAKTEERNAWRFYVPMMQADIRQRMVLAAELRQALLNDEFRVVYQPSVEMRTGRIVAVEALLRWRHPERGEVMPGDFIPVAESIGIIHRIDEWVMRAVCAQIRSWDDAHMPPIRVAVNVSARWFGHSGFVEGIRHALQSHGVEPRRIALEITEGAMLRLGEETERTMRALHALGIDVAIDDFGTGYASMAYLKLPSVAYLKIDRSFVIGLPDNANDVAITHAMLAMAGSLGLTTIAEGIEKEAQHEFLLRAGCVEGQGYLYAYPLPPAALERMLKPRQQPVGSKLKLVRPPRS
jgi:diguanylate cyclase (GGDEF)-like protein/PAS domain S-box-containing protein